MYPAPARMPRPFLFGFLKFTWEIVMVRKFLYNPFSFSERVSEQLIVITMGPFSNSGRASDIHQPAAIRHVCPNFLSSNRVTKL